jgi:hypothetical protein
MFLARYVTIDGELFERNVPCTSKTTALLEAANKINAGETLISVRKIQPTDSDPADDILDGTATGYGYNRR